MKEAASEIAGGLFMCTAVLCITFLLSQCQSRNFQIELMCLNDGGTWKSAFGEKAECVKEIPK